MSSVRLSLIVIRVADLERARRFYESLGLRFQTEQHGKGPEHLAANLDGLAFEIYPQGTSDPTSGCRLGFRVTDIGQVLAQVVERGGVVVSPLKPSEWGPRAVAEDPDGHRVELSQ